MKKKSFPERFARFAGLLYIALMIAFLLWGLFLVGLIRSCNAQTPQTYLHTLQKGDTLVAPFDSIVAISKLRLRAYVGFERGKADSLFKLSLNKDKAVKALNEAHKEEVTALRNQIAALQSAYQSVFDSTRIYLAVDRANNESAQFTLNSLEYHAKQERIEMEAFKSDLKKKSRLDKWIWGGAGVGVGAIIVGILMAIR